MDFNTFRTGCPNRVMINTGEAKSHCKALLSQPNKTLCSEDNCAGLHIADLLINDLRAEIYSALEKLMPEGGEVSEDSKGTAAASGGNKS